MIHLVTILFLLRGAWADSHLVLSIVPFGKNIVLEESTDLNLTCKVKSQDSPHERFDLSWKLPTRANEDSDRISVYETYDQLTVTIHNLQADDSGIYICELQNKGIRRTKNVTVFVRSKKCAKELFDCGNGVCVPKHYVCDGYVDCPSGYDESFKHCGPDACHGKILCDRRCIPKEFCCDPEVDVNCSVNYTMPCCQGILYPGGGFATSSIQQKNLPDCIQKEVAWSSIEMKGVALLSEHMKDLLIKSSDHDLTICVQNKTFRAHRNILSVRSPVFAMMLDHDSKESNTSTINIDDCDPESFDEFLLYVYSGRTENLTSSNALHLYYSADKYDFPVLKEWCVDLLKTSLSVESICDVVLLAVQHQEEELLEVATEFFARNMKKILVTDAWQKFMVQNPVEANELILKSVDIVLP